MKTYNPPRYIPALRDRLADIYWSAPELWAAGLFGGIMAIELVVLAQFV